MKKNYLLICACTVAAFAFSGCGNSSAPEPTPSSEAASTEAVASEAAPSEAAAEPSAPAAEADEDFVAPYIELPQLEPVKEGDQIATIVTDMGEIKLRLFPEYAPKAVENFVTHAKNGYYDGVIFHRVIDNFMLQTGDPEGTGMGGESIWGEDFEDEVTPNLHNIRGAVSMANAGANTNGSQFFIVQNKEISDNERQLFESSKDDMNQSIGEDASGRTVHLSEMYPERILDEYLTNGGTYYLDFVHTVFGQVYEGMDVVDAIAAVEKDENDKPIKDILIQKIEIGEYK